MTKLESVKLAALAMQRHNWEQGVLSQAFLEAGDHETAILFAIEFIHEKRKTLTEMTDRLPVSVRGLLYLAGVMAIVIFGVWGPGYTAQAFIYFQF